MRVEPDRKGLGEVFHRVRLGVPIGEVDDKIPALRERPVRRGVRCGRVSKQQVIALAVVEAVRPINRMPGFMSKYASGFGLASSLNLQHLTAL